MTLAIVNPSNLITIEDYLNYDDGTDALYELVNGELVEMPTESLFNCQIAKLLMFELAKYIPIVRICLKDIEIVVSGSRAKIRRHDLAVLSEDGYLALAGQRSNTVTYHMPAPILVVEEFPPVKKIAIATTAISEPNMQRGVLMNIGLSILNCDKLRSVCG